MGSSLTWKFNCNIYLIVDSYQTRCIGYQEIKEEENIFQGSIFDVDKAVTKVKSEETSRDWFLKNIFNVKEFKHINIRLKAKSFWLCRQENVSIISWFYSVFIWSWIFPWRWWYFRCCRSIRSDSLAGSDLWYHRKLLLNYQQVQGYQIKVSD